MTSPFPRRGAAFAALAAGSLLLSGLASGAPALAAPAVPTAAPAAFAAPAAPAATSPVTVQEWLYPGKSGSVTCSAAAEYADGRVQNGVLKPEYYDFDTNGNAVLAAATNSAYACNGYSAANAADVKAHSAQQYMTISLADLPSEEALTGSAAKSAAGVKTVTDFAKSIGFTGVDVDFENYWDWKGQDQANYYTFLTNLATSLHNAGLKLQVEGPPDTTTGFNYGSVLAAGADQVVMMAYDDEYQSPAGSTCLAFSPYDWMKDLITSALAQIPTAQRGRFVAGLPAEAYTATANCQNIVGNQTVLDMTKAPGYSTDPQVIASRRDPDSGEIRWSSGGAFYDYVDQTALDSKLALVRSLGVSNVSVWALGGGNAWFSAGALGGGGGTGPGFVSSASGRCMDVPGSVGANSTRLDVHDCDGSAGQAVVQGTGNTLQVLGKCVDASGRKTTAGTPVILYTCSGATNQQWTRGADGSFTGVQSGLCLDVTGGAVNAPNGTQLELWPCTGQANQIWTPKS
ncbi:hypothetical protein GCM10009665_47640 [Kitasatospora nipponensis]|uniref:Ricin B lectin domain-containing protein n=1 Tax=Kitasatospora nipponensis TaxID=258049 RepID=A0ABP4HAI4_9ACTN